MSSENLNAEFLQRLNGIEQTLTQRLEQIEEQLNFGKETFQFFADGLKANRDRYLKAFETSNNHLNDWYTKIRNDKALRFPHRKILEFLLSQYDFQERIFKEVHFSKLVREASVGKNMAKTYLSFLEQTGYVEKRDDGYRVFFKIHE